MFVWIARIDCRDSVPLDVAESGAHCLLFCFEGVLLFHAALLSRPYRHPFRWHLMSAGSSVWWLLENCRASTSIFEMTVF